LHVRGLSLTDSYVQWENFGEFWGMWGNFEEFWRILRSFGEFWGILGNFGNFGEFMFIDMCGMCVVM
jgi:hypothetical protein